MSIVILMLIHTNIYVYFSFIIFYFINCLTILIDKLMSRVVLVLIHTKEHLEDCLQVDLICEGKERTPSETRY